MHVCNEKMDWLGGKINVPWYENKSPNDILIPSIGVTSYVVLATT